MWVVMGLTWLSHGYVGEYVLNSSHRTRKSGTYATTVTRRVASYNPSDIFGICNSFYYYNLTKDKI